VIDPDLLRRWPDVEAPELLAHDATDRLLLDEAAPRLFDVPDVVVIGDRYGALTLGALSAGAASVRVHQDALSGERALVANASRVDVPLDAVVHHGLEPALVAGARLVLLQLPRSLDALDEIAALVAAHAAPDVVLVAGGRVKHMTRAMNDVLGRHFDQVQAGLARQKSRLLTASGPRRGGSAPWPRSQRHDDLGITVVAHGAVFAGSGVDIGTRQLLDVLDRMPEAASVVDLGCGTGLLAVEYARRVPSSRVVATDQSSAAVASARATIDAAGLSERVEVRRADAGDSLPEGSADLVLLNPPFHVGATVHAAVAQVLFDAAARLLRPGGELWTVYNSSLGHRPALERTVGPTRQVTRSPKFTVTASTRR
jgi:16S rRNA (guanine1207-N2)-methyltransferase